MAGITNSTFDLDAKGMDLGATLASGQCFCWREAQPGVYSGAAGHYAATLRQQGGRVLITPQNDEPGAQAFWRDYFDLDSDYEKMQRAFCRNPALARCVEATRGIRILRQPFYDTLLCFILSQNNHIGRITQIVTRLRQTFGPALSDAEHGFPAPQALAALGEGDLVVLRAGFRAKYLIDAAQKLASGAVSEQALRGLGDEEARALLCSIKGVGPKVADCVLLYGLGRQGIAPMDVWMKRASAQLFGGGFPPEAAGSEGVAQQHIFCWARDNLPRGS